MNKHSALAILELAKLGGAVPVSEWTNGSGRYTTRRSLPEGAREWNRYSTDAPDAVKVIFESRPRVERVIGLVDVEATKAQAMAYLVKKRYPIPQ